MKKLLSIILLCGCCIAFIGCGNEKRVENTEQEVETLSNHFIKLESWDCGIYGQNGICYDKDTMIIYIYQRTYRGNYVYTPYYVRDMNDNAVIGIYNGDE